MDEIEKMMDETIRKQLEDVSDMPSGSDKKSAALGELERLHRMKIERQRLNCEEHDREEKRLTEQAQLTIQNRHNSEQLKAQKRKNVVECMLTAAGIAAPLICYGAWYRKGLEFEKTGTVTSGFFRNLINKFKPTGK